jgi:hypothetical protein
VTRAELELAARPVAVYCIGGPGSGKSTTLTRALRYLEWSMLDEEVALYGLLKGHLMVAPDGQVSGRYLGRLRMEFSGTDALSFGVHPDAVKWAKTPAVSRLSLVAGEGARLTTTEFIRSLAAHTRLVLVMCRTSPELLTKRRPEQKHAWQAGRSTAAENVFAAARELAAAAEPTGPPAAEPEPCAPWLRVLEVDSSSESPAAAGDRVGGLVLSLLMTQRVARTALEGTP